MTPRPMTMRRRAAGDGCAAAERRPRVWLIGPKEVVARLSLPVERYASETLTPARYRAIAKAPADLAVIVGHGREDLVYFERLALCGRAHAQTACAGFPCSLERCPYPQPKVAIQEVNASLVVLLSCNAVRVGAGLFPRACRLHECLLAAGTRAVLGPSAIFTGSAELVEVVLRPLLAGRTFGEVCRALNRWQRRRIGTAERFVVAGDGAARLHGAPARDTSAVPRRGPGGGSGAVALTHESDRLRRVERGLFELRELGLETPAQRALADVLRENEPLLSAALLHLRTGSTQHRVSRRALELVGREIEAQDHALAVALAQRSREEFFWLAARTPTRFVVAHRGGSCRNCRGRVARDRWRNALRPDADRTRCTCERCGIVADAATGLDGVRLSVGRVRLGAETAEVRIRVQAAPLGFCQVASAVNHAGATLTSTRAVCGGREVVLPAVVDVGRLQEIWLTLARPRVGVHYAQLFLVRDLSIASASVPLPLWPG